MRILPPLLYRGSVKNIRGKVSAESLLFEFSDRYSVFDWGEMPDQLEGKGRALAIMGKLFFSYLENPKNWSGLFQKEIIRKSFSSSYLNSLQEKVVYKKLCVKGLSHHAFLNDNEAEWNSQFLKVKKISVLRPPLKNQSYDYSIYKQRPINALVPLEIIFRLGLPEGNSLSKRLGTDSAGWRKFGFYEIPKTGQFLNKPLIDFSTKLEKGDRYLSYAEAKEIAELNETEWHELHQMTHLIALNLFSLHHDIGLELWDGKIEMAYVEGSDGNRSFMLVDSIGIDELRLLYEKKSFSKEFLRESYKGSKWYKDLEASKKESLIHGGDFKAICLGKYQSEPLGLETSVKLRAESVYKSYCNTLCKTLGTEAVFENEHSLENYRARYL